MSLNRHLIFARLLRSRSAGTIRKPKAAGAYTTPRDIMPMTSAAHSAPTLLHRDENSTAPLDAPRPRRGAVQADRSAAPRVRPVAASAHCAALNFKREAASPHHVEIPVRAHRARKAPQSANRSAVAPIPTTICTLPLDVLACAGQGLGHIAERRRRPDRCAFDVGFWQPLS